MIGSMFIPGAVHGIEASFLADTSLRELHRLLDSVAEGCPGHGPAYLLVESAAESRQLG